MKKLVVVFLTLVLSDLTFSQMFNGKITYQATIIVDDTLQKNSSFIRSDNDVLMPEGLKDLEIKSGKDAIPTNFILFFNENESLYRSGCRLPLIRTPLSSINNYYSGQV